MKKTYTSPEMDIEKFLLIDCFTSSDTLEGGGETGEVDDGEF